MAHPSSASSAPGGTPTTDSRGAWNSKVGFILASIGAAVGLGNLVLFPFRTATNGGAGFVLVYVGMLLVVGIPALLAELAIGRRFRLNPYGAFREAGIEGARERGRISRGRGSRFIGVLAIATAILLLSYYTVITGWALDFVIRSIDGAYLEDPGSYFDAVEQGPYTLFLHGLVMLGVVLIVAPGVSRGIERAVTIMMPVLFIVILGITIYGLMQSGARAGLSFYLSPNLSEITAETFLDAAGQTFFSVGIGLGLMVTYASYMDRDSDLTKDAGIIGFADLGVALLGGLMVFPLVFTYGLQHQLSDSSTGMLFQVLPQAFGDMGGFGVFVAFVFFVALTFAALSSGIALLEVCVATVADEFGATRWKAAALSGLAAYTLGIPSALSANGLDIADALMSRVLLIASGVALTIFAGWFLPTLADDIDEGARFKVGRFTVWMLRLVVPLVLVVTFVFGWEETVQRVTGR